MSDHSIAYYERRIAALAFVMNELCPRVEEAWQAHRLLESHYTQAGDTPPSPDRMALAHLAHARAEAQRLEDELLRLVRALEALQYEIEKESL